MAKKKTTKRKTTKKRVNHTKYKPLHIYEPVRLPVHVIESIHPKPFWQRVADWFTAKQEHTQGGYQPCPDEMPLIKPPKKL